MANVPPRTSPNHSGPDAVETGWGSGAAARVRVPTRFRCPSKSACSQTEPGVLRGGTAGSLARRQFLRSFSCHGISTTTCITRGCDRLVQSKERTPGHRDAEEQASRPHAVDVKKKAGVVAFCRTRSPLRGCVPWETQKVVGERHDRAETGSTSRSTTRRPPQRPVPDPRRTTTFVLPREGLRDHSIPPRRRGTPPMQC